jgi:hypothetical protein
MSEASNAVLVEEIESAISEIISTNSAKCPAHEPMARGVVVLLRVAKVQMQAQSRTLVVSGVTSSLVSGLLIGVGMALKHFGVI